MANVLRRICRNKEWLASLEQMAGVPFQVMLPNEKVLWGELNDHSEAVSVAILDQDETIGCVIAPARCINELADIFNHFVQQEQEKRRLAEETLERYRELTILYESAEQFAAVMDPYEIASKVATEIGKVVPNDGISFFLLDQYGLSLEHLYSSAIAPVHTVTLGEGLLGQIALNDHGEIVNDLNNDPRFQHELPASSALCIPMRLKEKLIGLVCVFREQYYQYTAADLKLVAVLVFQACTAIENARLYDKLKASYEELEKKQQELETSYQRQTEFSFLFTSIILVISLYMFLVGLFNITTTEHDSLFTIQFYASRLLELAVLGLVVAIVIRSNIPIERFGVTLKGWREAVGEAVVISLPLMVLMAGAKFWLMGNTSWFGDDALLNWSNYNYSYVSYILVAPLQEFVARGVFQTTIERLLVGRHRHLWAIMNTALVFGALHMHSSLNLAIAAFVTSWLWGFMYVRKRTLVGVSVSHFLLGNFADLLGFWKFF